MIAQCDKHIERFHAVVKHTGPGKMYVDCPHCGLGYHLEDGIWMADRRLLVHSMADVYGLVVHKRSRDFFTFDRGYNVHSINDVQISLEDLMHQYIASGFVQREYEHRQACWSIPAWAENRTSKEFTTFWLY